MKKILVSVVLLLGAAATICWSVCLNNSAELSDREAIALAEILESPGDIITTMSVNSDGYFMAQGSDMAGGSANHNVGLDYDPLANLGYLKGVPAKALRDNYPKIQSPKAVTRFGSKKIHFLVFESWSNDNEVIIVTGVINTKGGGGWKRLACEKKPGGWRIKAMLTGRAINMWSEWPPEW